MPLPAAVGAKVRFRTQLLPVLTDAHTKVPGPLQPAGKVPNEPVMAKPVMGRASLDVNTMLSVWLAPVTTDTVPATEGVAITESLVPEMPPAPLKLLPPLLLPLPLVPVPLAPFTTAALVPEELYPQPEMMSDEIATRSSVRWTVGISFSMHVIEQQRSERQRSYSLHRRCGINCVTQ
jgi:hypothetical protein